MKKSIKSIAKITIKYILIFLVTLLILLTFLVATAKIPREAITDNIRNSTKEFSTRFEVDEVVMRREYTFRHVYADAMVLNIEYCIDSNKPLESVMEAKYYAENYDKFIEHENKEKKYYERYYKYIKEKYNEYNRYAKEKQIAKRHITYNFNQMIDNKVKGNVEYLRYWHGYVGIIRILLVFFDLGQIYIFNGVMLTILAIILLVSLIKKKAVALIIALIVGSIMGAVYVVPSCLEYTWMFYIMLITSIIAIKLKDDDKKLNKLFFITGILACFFDFLSTEVLTIAIPVIIVLVLNTKDKKITNFKEGFKFIFRSFLLWGISYASMWIAKWTLASIILKINALDYVIEDAKIRINDKSLYGYIENLHWEAVTRNLFTLYPLNTQKRISKLAVIPVIMLAIETIIIRKKDFKKLWLSALLLLISTVPYLRYLILANHSCTHYFFTFRSQIITVVAIILAMIYSTNLEFINNQIKKVKFKIKEKYKKKVDNLNII